MNDNELESFLRERPARVLPETWRDSILRIARREARSNLPAAAAPLARFSFARLVRRNPVTVGGLAVLWALILLLKTSTPVDRDAERLLAQSNSQPASPSYVMPLRERWLLAQLLQGDGDTPPVQRP